MSLPYTDTARAQGWTPRGWFGLTEPQQALVLRGSDSAKEWGLDASDWDLPTIQHEHDVTVNAGPGTFVLVLAALTAWVVLR